MPKLRINVNVDRYEPMPEVYKKYPIYAYFDIVCQVLRFDKDMNLVATLSHTRLIKLRDRIDEFIIAHKLKGNSVTKE